MNLTQKDWDFSLKNEIRQIIDDETAALRFQVSVLERDIGAFKARPRIIVQKNGFDTDMLKMIGGTVKAAFTSHLEKEMAPVLTRLAVLEALINQSRGYVPIAPSETPSKTFVTKRGPRGEIQEFVKLPASIEEIKEVQRRNE